MSKKPAIIIAACITGGLALAGVIINVVVNPSKKNEKPSVSVVTTGESSPGIAIGGDLKNSQIVVNPSPQEGLTKDVRTVVNQVFEAMDTISSDKPKWASESSLLPKLDEELIHDPYNVRALLIRGQTCYTGAASFNGQGMRQGLADFEKANSVDKTLADPHFGIGTVLYHLGFFDLAQRGRYKIYEKGGFRFNKKAGKFEMRSPRLEFFPDRRNSTIFQAALEEFETGQKLAQIHDRSDKITVFFFAPQDIENRIRSIRQFLGHEPRMERDDQLIMAFTTALSKVNPAAFGLLFEIEKGSE
jgi:hypothetical protein